MMPLNPQQRATRAPTAARAVAAMLCTSAVSGCYLDSSGRIPDSTEIYFPTALVVSAGRTTLYVANSDFDLRFSGGSVQAVDLAALRAAVSPIAAGLSSGAGAAAACAASGLGVNDNSWLNPGPCAPMAYAPLVRSATLIGAFASSALLVHREDGPGARLFVPVRGDPSLTYFDVADDRPDLGNGAGTFGLDCGTTEEGFCDDAHRLGRDPERSLRGVQLPADPMGIAASADGRAVVTVHQTQKAASLVVNDWDVGPQLTYFTSSLAEGPTEVVALPVPGVVRAASSAAAEAGTPFEYRDGFLVSYRSASESDIVRYYPDTGASPPRPFLVRSSATAVTTSVSNVDSRGLALLADERERCENDCTDALDIACQRGCAQIPIRAFMANRNPASLLLGEVRTDLDTAQQTDPTTGATTEQIVGASETVWFYDSVPLNYGASRVETGLVVDDDGVLAPRVFAVCFDTRSVFIFDPARNRVEATIRTGRGPHDIAVDSGLDADGNAYSFLIVGHFTDSYLGVVDLDRRRPTTYGQMIASVGTPNPPQEAK